MRQRVSCIIIIAFLINIIYNQNEFQSRIHLYLDSLRLMCYVNKNCLYLSVNLESSFNYLTNVHYPNLSFNNEFSLNFPEHNLTVKTETITSSFQIKELDYCEINNFTFYRTEDNDMLSGVYETSLAFAYSIPHKSHSITHWLKSLNIISNLQFTIQYESKHYGIIHFGDIPSRIQNSTYTASTKVKGNKGLWGFSLDYVFIDHISYLSNNTYYSNNYPAHFASINKLILIPKEAYVFMLTNYFNDTLFNNTSCRKQSYGKMEVSCNCEIISSLSDIMFVINGYSFRFAASDLFDKHGDFPFFYIQMNEKEEWVFGNVFFSRYSVTFDYDNKELRMISKKRIEKIDLESLFPLKKTVTWIVVSVIGLALLVIVIYLRALFTMRKRKRIQKTVNLNREFLRI